MKVKNPLTVKGLAQRKIREREMLRMLKSYKDFFRQVFFRKDATALQATCISLRLCESPLLRQHFFQLHY